MDSVTRPVRELLVSAAAWTWGPLVNLARNTILSFLSNIDNGSLKITDCDGRVTLCGAAQLNGVAKIRGFAPFTELQIHRDTFWVRMLLFADMVCLSLRLEADESKSSPHTNVSRVSQRVSCLERSHVPT